MKITNIRSMKLWGPLLHGQGGDTTRKIADLVELNHLPMAMRGNGGALAAIAAAHVAAASRNFPGLEYHFIETPWIGEYVKRGTPLFKDGHIPLIDAPGVGVELNEKVCRKFLAKGEKMLV